MPTFGDGCDVRIRSGDAAHFLLSQQCLCCTVSVFFFVVAVSFVFQNELNCADAVVKGIPCPVKTAPFITAVDFADLNCEFFWNTECHDIILLHASGVALFCVCCVCMFFFFPRLR